MVWRPDNTTFLGGPIELPRETCFVCSALGHVVRMPPFDGRMRRDLTFPLPAPMLPKRQEDVMHRYCWPVLLTLLMVALGCSGDSTTSPQVAAEVETPAPEPAQPATPAPEPDEAAPALKIGKDHVVAMDYTLTGPDGNVIDTSKGREPLYYLTGASNIISGLEKALVGMGEGEELTVTVPAAEAYGEWNEKLVEDVPREEFADLPNLKAGDILTAQSPQGARNVKVLEVGEKTVKIDMNHELAGTPLTFAVKIVNIRPATAEEVTHGHVHGPGGTNH